MLRHRYIPQRLAKAVRDIKGGVDVVHAHEAYEYAAAAALLANKWPVFCTSRDWLPYLKSFPMSRTERLLFYAKEQCYKRVMACRKMHFIANSEYMRRCMDSVNGVTTVAVIPNSVRHEFILQQEKHYPEVPTFLFMAQSIDERRKNVTTLLRAFALLLKETPESRLLIVGRYGKEDGSVWQRGRGEA